MRRILAAQPQVTAVNLDWNGQSLAVKAQLDQDKIKALGLSSDEVGRLVALQLSGTNVTQFRENDLLIDVVLRTPRSEHRDVDALQSLPIGRFNGQSVTLGQIATFQPGFEDGVIWRRDRLPTISVRGDPVGKTQPATIIESIAPQVAQFKAQLPPGFRLEIGGPVESSAKANAAIGASWPLIVITTLTLLMLQLGSFSRSLLVVLTAPLGLIGVAIALLVSGRPMGFVALLGIISLAGMIMRNSVILVDQIQQDIRARAVAMGCDHRIDGASDAADQPHRRRGGAGDDSVVAFDFLGTDGGGGDGRIDRGHLADAVFPAGAVCSMVPGQN